jgi:hypothetical protein
MASIQFDRHWKQMIKDMELSIRNSNNYKREFIDLLAQGLLKVCKDLSPVKDGQLRDSWQVTTKSMKQIIIETDMVDSYGRITQGMRPQTIVAKNGKAMHYYIGNKEFFRQKVEILGTPKNEFLQVILDKAVDKVIHDLGIALMVKHRPFFKKSFSPTQSSRTGTKRHVNSNLSKAVGLTGTKRNTRRGRGGGVQRAKTGRKSFKRTLSRRRRTGAFITTKEVKL